MEPQHKFYTRKAWIYVICLLIALDCFFHMLICYDVLFALGISAAANQRNSYFILKTQYHPKFGTKAYYEYPLVIGAKASKSYGADPYNSSYYWFTSMKKFFKDIGADARPRYLNDTPVCELNTSCGPVEPITLNQTEPNFDWIEKQNPDVKLGGYFAPTHCRATSKVAVVIPCRDSNVNLKALLRYLHPLLQKKLLEYRIFVIEQFGTERFNKGSLYNIAFLETQRFGTWDCLVFHDVDLIPDKDIPYTCPQRPEGFSPTAELYGYSEYRNAVGSVTAVSPKDFEAMDGFCNTYWGKGGGQDYYNNPQLFEIPTGRQGLRGTKYNLLNVTEEKLYTHISADLSVVRIIV